MPEVIHSNPRRVSQSANVRRMFPEVKFVGDGALLRGLGSLHMMIDLIGEGDRTDHDLAALLVDNEQDVRELLKFAGEQLFAMMQKRVTVPIE